MPSPSTNAELLDLIRKSGVVEEKRLNAYMERLRAANNLPAEPNRLAGQMVVDGLLTTFQAEQVLLGKWRRFTIGKYKVLERLGAGGMGSVYLCEHKLMRRRVAVKVLPTAKADDPASLERFYREARAVAALDHPNIVRAYDIDQDEKLHFLVMEHVDGANLQEMLKRSGPMDVLRACHYMRQAALGLQHAFETAGLVHRDIKPGNILVDRNGIVKILDMGLARFFHDQDDVLTKKYDENVLGTADYLAPEQALDSHAVDIRADIYSLGATFYFCLTGRTPFAEGTVAQKLIWHQTRQPKSIRAVRPDVPDAVVAIIDKMMAKDASQRYQSPLAVAEALAPLTQTPIPPPPEHEMPQLSPAAMGVPACDPNTSVASRGNTSPELSPPPRKPWQVPPAPTPAAGLPAQAAPPPPAPPPLPAPAAAAAVAAPEVRKSSNPVLPSLPQPPALPVPAPAAPPVPALANASVTAPAPAPAVLPRGPEENAAWNQLAPETDKLTARADTDRSSRRRRKASVSAPATQPGMPALPASQPAASRKWLWISLAAAALALLVGGLAWWSSTPDKDNKNTNIEPTPAPRRMTIVVDGQGQARGTAATLRRALEQVPAQGNARIIIKEDVVEANIRVIFRNVTIEGEDDKPWKWSCPKGAVAAEPLLLLNNAEGFHLKGCQMDGAGKVETLIKLLARCPDLTLEHLQLTGFTKHALVIANCEGASGRPVTLKDLTIRTSAPTQAGFFFFAHPSIQSIPKNRFFLIQDCPVEGPGVKAKTPNAEFQDNVKFEPPVPWTIGS